MAYSPDDDPVLVLVGIEAGKEGILVSEFEIRIEQEPQDAEPVGSAVRKGKLVSYFPLPAGRPLSSQDISRSLPS